MNALAPANTWSASCGCGGSSTDPSMAYSVVVTGVPATIGSWANGFLAWTITLNDGASPPNFTVDRYDAGGAIIDHPLSISGVDGLVRVTNDPSDALGVATKQYVDLHGSGTAQVQVVVQSGSSLTINFALGGNCLLNLTASVTSVSVIGWPAAGLAANLNLTIVNGGAFGITGWPASVEWPGGATPTISSGAGKRDILDFTTNDGGITVYGVVVGQNFSTIPAPVNTVAPAVTPTSAGVGVLLTCTSGTWTASPTPTYAYQWLRDGTTPIGTGSTYTTVSGDNTHFVNCAVTATNINGSTTANSNSVAVVASTAYTYPGTPLALYALRKLGNNVTGIKCLQVMRGDTHTTSDIDFNGTTGVVDMAAVASFCAGTNAYVNKWYDQSGNGRDFLASGPTTGPQINMINGKPWLAFMYSNVGAHSLSTAAAMTLTADQTIGFVGQSGADFITMVMAQWNGANGWFMTFNGTGTAGAVGSSPGVFQSFSTGGGGVVLADTGRYFGKTGRYVAKRSSGAGTLYVNGTQTKTGSSPSSLATTAPLTLGSDSSPSYYFTGLIGEVFVYASALSDTDRNAIDANQATALVDTTFSTPYSGTSCVQFGFGEQISCGSVLNYERTVSWTVFAAVQFYYSPDITATVIYTNVPASGNPFGHEIWVDNIGRLRVRLMGNWDGVNGHSGMAGVIGTTNVIDGKKHMIAYSYSGTSNIAGIKIYIDGVLETVTTEADNLTTTMIGGSQTLVVGSQAAQPGFNIMGTLSHFQIDNVARSAGYIATYVPGSGTLIPPIDANTDICLALNAGSGTAVADTSGHARNGTLTTATMWVP